MSYVSNVSAPYISPNVYTPTIITPAVATPTVIAPAVYSPAPIVTSGYNNAVVTTTTVPAVTNYVEETVIAPPIRQGQYQLLNAGPRYWEENYLLPPARDSEIARVPPSKDTHMHINDDPSLGGETWRVPKPNAPLSDFNNACKITPFSDDYTRIIPWDHERKDYVYGAVDDYIFRGRYDRRRLKRKLDHVKQHGAWDPTGSYNKCFICCLITGGIFLFLWILAWIYRPYWWWCWLFGNTMLLWLLPLFVLMILLTWCCICKAAANHSARNRYRYIKHALDDVNDRHLRGSGVSLRPGTKAAWIEVDMDPDRTDIVGGVVEDVRLYNGEDHVKMVEMEVERREDLDAMAQIPIENRPKNQTDVVEVYQQDRTVVQTAGFTGPSTITPTRIDTPVVQQTIVNTVPVVPVVQNNLVQTTTVNQGIVPAQSYVSGPSYVSNPSYVTETVISQPAQMSFYERMKAQKMATRTTELLSGNGDVNE
jgi:hypothetical protein